MAQTKRKGSKHDGPLGMVVIPRKKGHHCSGPYNRPGDLWALFRSVCVKMRFAGNQTPIALLDWMYKDSTIETRLDRKYLLYKETLKHVALNPRERKVKMDEFRETQKWKDVSECTKEFCPKLRGCKTVPISFLGKE